MVDAGVMRLICSKNDEISVKECLKTHNIWDLMVFPSISWVSEGRLCSANLNEMNLRPVNVLLIDDNHTNRAEVKFVNELINVSDVDVIPEMVTYICFEHPFLMGMWRIIKE